MKELIAETIDNIEEIYNDDSVSKDVTIERLEKIKAHTEALISDLI